MVQHTIARSVRPLAVATAATTILVGGASYRYSETESQTLALFGSLAFTYTVAVAFMASPTRVERRGGPNVWVVAVVAVLCAQSAVMVVAHDDARGFVVAAMIMVVVGLVTVSWAAWALCAGTSLILVGTYPGSLNDAATGPLLYTVLVGVVTSGVAILVRRGTIGRVAVADMERQAAVTQSEATAAQMRSITEAASDGVVIVDEEGRVTGWNAAAERMFGYTRDEALGMDLSVVIPRTYLGVHGGWLGVPQNKRVGGGMFADPTEIRGIRKDGRRFAIELTLGEWQVDDATYFSGVLRDVSDRKRAEEAQRRADMFAVKQRNALDINEQVVQGIVTSMYALDDGDDEGARESLSSTLASARSMITSTLGDAKLADILRDSTAAPTDGASAPVGTDQRP